MIDFLTDPGIEPVRKKTIALASGKGGVGKTTTAANLAVYYARKGLNIGIIDLDPFSDIASLFDRSEEHTSELQSHSFISYAVFCLKKKKTSLSSFFSPFL